MARPRADDYDDKRKAILKTSAALFAEHGYDRASMNQIAKEAQEAPEIVKQAPHHTRLKRLDEARAARKPVLRWRPPTADAD